MPQHNIIAFSVLCVFSLATFLGLFVLGANNKNKAQSLSHDWGLTICTAFLVAATIGLGWTTWALKISTDNIFSEERRHSIEEWQRENYRVDEEIANASKLSPTAQECERYILSVDTDPAKEAEQMKPKSPKAASLLEALVEDDRLPPDNWLRPGPMLDACLMGLYLNLQNTDIENINNNAKFFFIRHQIDVYFSSIQEWADFLQKLPDIDLFKNDKFGVIDNIYNTDVEYLSKIAIYETKKAEIKGRKTTKLREAEIYNMACRPITIMGVQHHEIDCVKGIVEDRD